MFIDTHCHIHEAGYPLDPADTLLRAHKAGVASVICVGTNEQSSREALDFASNHANVAAAIGVHPHDSKDGYDAISQFADRADQNLKAIGEIGLDYYYTHSPRDVQCAAFEAQLQIARDNDLPVIFHVREAFEDFWPIVANFPGIRGVLHSFTDNRLNMERGLATGFYVGVNGISTFTKDDVQRSLLANIPLDRLLLETDAPFLTPAPHRGKVNEPAFVRFVGEAQARERGISLEELAAATTANARELFSL